MNTSLIHRLNIILNLLLRANLRNLSIVCSSSIASTSLCESVHSHILHPVEMHECSSDDQDMKDLMRLEPDVTLPRQEALRYPGPIEHGPQDVEPPHDEHPVYGGLHQGGAPPRHDQEVHGGHKAKATQADKQESSEWSVLAGREPVEHSDDDGADTKHGDDGKVNHFRGKLAVETVVDPGDKTSNCKKADTDIIKLTKKLGYVFRVTTDCVEEAGESQAEDSTKEEEEEDKLLPECEVCVTLVTQGLDIEDDCHGDKSHKSYEVCPDVASLRMNTKY